MERLLKGAGKILEMCLNGNTRGDYIRVRVNHNIKQPLTKFVSVVRAQERQFIWCGMRSWHVFAVSVVG